MPSKLGLHVNFITGANRLLEFAHTAQPAVMKSLHHDNGFWQEVKSASPQTFLLGRLYVEHQDLSNPRKAAEEMARLILAQPTAHTYDAWEGLNETPRSQLDARCEFDVRLAELLFNEHIRYACGSWSVGVPDLQDWSRNMMWAALHAADYIAVHEYSAPRMDDPRGMDGPDSGWYTLRYRKWYPSLIKPEHRKPLIISECGIDGGATPWTNRPGQGWRCFASPQEYLEQLIWYDHHLRRDPYVLGAAIFCCGTLDPAWDSFDVIPEDMLRLLQDYIVSQQDQNAERDDPPAPAPDPPPDKETEPVELPQYFDLFLKHQIPGLLPWYLLAAQAFWESAMNPTALSPAGAWGLAQFMPETWAEFGQGDPTNPEDAIRAQAAYLKHCHAQLAPLGRTQWRWLIAAYTAGPAAAKRCTSWDDWSTPVKEHVTRVIQKAREYKRLIPEEE